MERFAQLILILTAGLAVAAADVLMKRIGSISSTLSQAMVSPWMLPVVLLYGTQVVLFTYVFVRRWDLGMVALVQMAFYVAACVLIGRSWFGERMTAMQGLGMWLTVIGILLMYGSVGGSNTNN
jgi:hypothetical protein